MKIMIIIIIIMNILNILVVRIRRKKDFLTEARLLGQTEEKAAFINTPMNMIGNMVRT